MTPREVQWRIESERTHDDHAWERVAQLACWVINPWMGTGQKISSDQLLGRPQTDRIDWGPLLKG